MTRITPKRVHQSKSFLLRFSTGGSDGLVRVHLEEITNKGQIHRFADLDSFFKFLRQQSGETEQEDQFESADGVDT